MFIGLDVGTSAVKAVAIRGDGRIAGRAAHEYSYSTPQPGWAEVVPEVWWDASCQALQQLTSLLGKSAADIAGLGLTGQMHGLVALDRRGFPLRGAIMWNDQRTATQCAEFESRIGQERIAALTGNRLLPGFTAGKLLWMKEHERKHYDRISTILLPKDFVRLRLSGVCATDVTDASGTLLFDCRNRRWSLQMISALHLNVGILPPVHESCAVCAQVTAEAAAKTGLPVGTPIVAGAGDQAASAIGCGVVGPGAVSCTIGTSGVVFAASESFRSTPDGNVHAFCHAAPGSWHLMAVMLSAGGSLQWFRDTLCADLVALAKAKRCNPAGLIMEEAATAPPGADGLLFLPYLTGERSPHADPHARGAFVGLSTAHTRAHLARAVVEGITFGLADCLDAVRGAGVTPSGPIRLAGGGSYSAWWRQLCADTFDCRVAGVSAADSTALGAALLSAVGAGAFASVKEAAQAAAEVGQPSDPNTDTCAALSRSRRQYQALYQDLRHRFSAMAQRGGAAPC